MMEFFRQMSRSTAFLRDLKLKMKKSKAAQQSAREKIIEMRIDISITESIKEKLDKRLIPLVRAAESEANEELPINAIDLCEEYEANVNFYGPGNFKGKNAKVKIGQATGRPCKVKLTKIAVDNKETFLVLKILCHYVEDLWMWTPKIFGDGEIVIELMPHQGELNFDGEKGEGEGEQEEKKDPDLVPLKRRQKPAKKKAPKKTKPNGNVSTFNPASRVRSAIPNV